jgi:hypothetical protein
MTSHRSILTLPVSAVLQGARLYCVDTTSLEDPAVAGPTAATGEQGSAL